ncbi:NAD(P)/FAD-dependent oxidoreductase [Spirillospora sp. NPDC047279]|uniref:NAD(P)/FAD-dependent oxidoreductase n=1 Tax=Spirillospora sp. NPDC047279 TaxID=3155478 RepID=UPI00340B946A
MNENSYDVVIVGGGPAGLSGALALARSRRSVLVIDAGEPRNAPAAHAHNYLGREGVPPRELLAIGRDEVASYGGEIVQGTVTSVERAGRGFRVEPAGGSPVEARRLLVTTGLVDELPDVPGLAERWGKDVLHCPYCHGWEVRDQAIGVLATGPMAVHQVKLFRQLSDDVTLFVHTAPAPSQDERELLGRRGVKIVEGEVAGVEVQDDRLTGVRLASGEVVPRQALVVSPRFTARSGLLASLGLKPVDMEVNGHVVASHIPSEMGGVTEIPGVYVAGNVTDPMAQVIGSASAGLMAGARINADLVEEDFADAR